MYLYSLLVSVFLVLWLYVSGKIQHRVIRSCDPEKRNLKEPVPSYRKSKSRLKLRDDARAHSLGMRNDMAMTFLLQTVLSCRVGQPWARH